MIPDLRSEFRSVDLGDARRNRRMVQIMGRLQAKPDAGFPVTFKNPSELEAFYRLTNNAAVDHRAVLKPHRDASWKRAADDELVVVVHDTTFCSFSGETERDGLPRDGNKQGFFAHMAIAVSETTAPVVHGVVGLSVQTVWDGVWFEELGGDQRQGLASGSQRWLDLVEEVHENARPGTRLVHVMDREADDYALWQLVRGLGDDFVIRSNHDRRVIGGARTLSNAMAPVEFVVEREVVLSKRNGRGRPPKSRKTHPDRDLRTTRLSIRASTVEFLRPRDQAPAGSATMHLGVVEVIEREPPAGESPVHWRLVTTLPVKTPAAIERVVDLYRKRWLIEEFFKSLKTGCAFEKRQCESLESLVNVLAMLTPVAWRLLVLRELERVNPEAPASAALGEIELEVLRREVPARMLPRKATVRHVMLAIARLGGHQPSNGPPGWLVLARGLEYFLGVVRGWRAALKWAASRGSKTALAAEVSDM